MSGLRRTWYYGRNPRLGPAVGYTSLVGVRRRALARRLGARVAVEEVVGHQRYAVPHRRQDRPVLGPRQVVETNRDPQHDIGVCHWPVARGIGRQAIAAPALVRVEPGGVELPRVIGGDPQWRGREGGAALRQI